MRDILVTALVFGVLPFILKRPWIGILAWAWLSYMNPHRLTWGFAYTMPFAQIVALTLLVALLFSNEKKTLPMNKTVVIWVFFLFWMTLSTMFAINGDAAFDYYSRVVKIQLVTFLTVMLITSEYRLKWLIWVITLSIGFYSIKGGLFTITTGGGFRVYGPEGSFIRENNALGLATLMIIPLMYYLWWSEKKKWLRHLMLVATVLSLASAVGSQSRGALVALAAVAAYFWWQSNTKLISGIVLGFVLGIGAILMPQSWHDRMNSIADYENDPSAMSRIDAWEYSINVANDRFLGGGFNSWSKATYYIYNPDAIGVFVAHSIYFSVLADHGWIGFILFILILKLTWSSLTFVIRRSAETQLDDRVKLELPMLARMIKVSLVAYFSGGAFLSLSYFDLPWHLVAIAVIMRVLIERALPTSHKTEMLPKHPKQFGGQRMMKQCHD
ncbi:putative O-glycosylation ligase, exosortase A system-associated [Pseudomaricurvus alkylphenolicus]|uniref:putative O-glycosylation ligase, exosortase A system-associated n=1 Tax=Pseudomaricurvus alkylphenolicus TaxID=1306991 RepID=UPI0014215A6B|nr:putative O-glycosylation ligase, exosortase A system-associated [Pseudomaricurvus alkylphenolicus]